MEDISEIVRKSYNIIASDYYTYRDLKKFLGELDKFSDLLPKGAEVLDVGCGAGIPTAKYLVEKGFKVTGLDISETMVEMAKKNVPIANFIQGDMNDLDFDNNSFDGITSLYALFHVKRDNHLSIFKKFYDILKPHGILLINSGVNESESMSNFFGEKMFWSNFNPKTTLKLVKQVGFEI